MRPHKLLVFRDRTSRKTLCSTSYDGKEFPAMTIRATMARIARRLKVPEEDLLIEISIEWIFF